jgi:hypothetical protein
VIAPTGGFVVARRASSGVVIVLSCLGVAAAAWLVPASIEIVAWPSTGPARVALFASTVRLWLFLGIGFAAAAGLLLRLPGERPGESRAPGAGLKPCATGIESRQSPARGTGLKPCATGIESRQSPARGAGLKPCATGIESRQTQVRSAGLQSCAARARVLAPLLLMWSWTVPYLPWLPDRAPVLLILAGPLRWLIAIVAVAGACGVCVRSVGWQPAFPRPRRGGVFVTTLGLYACMGLWSLQTVGISGDEPHYLIITHSMLFDHDLQIENNHRRADYGAFFNGEMPPDYLRRGQNGAIYSVHAPGLPALLLPAYAIGGVRGAILMMCLLAALAALAVFDVATRLGGPTIGLVTWMSVCLTVPWMPFSWSLFPEMAAAAIVAWAVRWLLVPEDSSSERSAGVTTDAGPIGVAQGSSPALPTWFGRGLIPVAQGFSPAPRAWLWRGACLAALPWLHTKFVVLLAALTAFLLLRLRRHLWSAAALLLPIVLSSVAWIGFFYVVYGTPDPTAPYGASADLSVRFANLPRSLLGLLIDQKFGLLVYSPVYLVAGAGAWFVLRDRGRWSLTLALLVTTLLFVVSTSRYYMWWGGTKAPARFLVPVLPLVAPLIAVALARIRSESGRATVAVFLGSSLIVAGLGVFWPRGFLLSSDAHGIARLLEVIQGSAPVALALPTFTEADWLTPLPRVAPWAAAAFVAAGLALLVPRRRKGASLFWIGVVEATAFLFTGSLLAGPFSAAARAETVRRGRTGLMEAYNPDRVHGFDYARMARLDDAGLLRSSALTLEWQGSEAAEEGRIAGPFSLPPGRYAARVWFDGGGRQRDGDLLLSLGRGNVAARAAGPLENPTTLTFELPIAVRAGLELTAPQTARAARTAEIIPLAIVPGPRRLILPAVAVESIKDRPDAYLVYADDHTYPEGGVFWTRRTARGTVFVLPAGAPSIVLTLHVGPNAGNVAIDVGGERMDTVLRANETRRLSIAVPRGATSVPISVQASGSFVPIDVEPGSRDLRSLGCQVRVELP